MKILHLSIISIIGVFILFITLASQVNGQEEMGNLPYSYPENKTMQLSLSYEQAGITENNTEGYLHFRFFDAKTNNPIKNVSFFLHVTKGNQQLLYTQFYTQTGNATLKFQLGESDQQWHALPAIDPIFIGGFESSQFIPTVKVQNLSKSDPYHFEIEPVIFDISKRIIDQPSGIKFYTDFKFEQNYNSTIPSSYAVSQNITKIYQINCNGTNQGNIVFNISDAIISDLKTRDDSYAGFLIQNSGNGKMTSYIPLNLKMGPAEILLNGISLITISENIVNATHEIASMNLPDGNSTLEVAIPVLLGGNPHRDCSVVPEFGSLAVMIMTAIIAGAILIQRGLRY